MLQWSRCFELFDAPTKIAASPHTTHRLEGPLASVRAPSGKLREKRGGLFLSLSLSLSLSLFLVLSSKQLPPSTRWFEQSVHGPGSRKIRRPPQRPHRRCAESLLNGRASGEKQKQKQKHYVKREQHEHKLGKEGPSLLANTNAESARHLRRQLFEKLPLLRDSNLDLLLCGGERWGSMSHNEICTRNRTKTCQSAPETRNLLHLLQGAAGLSRGCPLPPHPIHQTFTWW